MCRKQWAGTNLRELAATGCAARGPAAGGADCCECICLAEAIGVPSVRKVGVESIVVLLHRSIHPVVVSWGFVSGGGSFVDSVEAAWRAERIETARILAVEGLGIVRRGAS